MKAIETSEQWARGENNITLDEVRAAGASASATAASAAAAASAKANILSQCADIVRVDYPNVNDLWNESEESNDFNKIS